MAEYTAKSVVFDIADNWGDVTYTGIRAIEFYYESALIAVADGDITAYGYTHSASYYPKYAFITGLSYDGDISQTCWSKNNVTAGRIICVFDTPITFDEVIYHNHTQPNPYYTSRGVKNVVTTISDDAITDTTYEATIANSEVISDEEWVQHASASGGDPQNLTLIPPGTLSISVNDSIVVNDVFWKLILGISIVDTISVTESIGILRGMADINIPTIIDNITVIESVSTEFTEINITDVYEEVIVSDVDLLQQITFFGTDPRPSHYPKLPTVSCEAAFRETFVIESKAPIVSCSGYFGTLITGEAPAPSAEITIQGLYAGYISVNSKVPVAEGTGLFGSIVTGKAPTVSCSATLANRDITVSSYAPVVTAEIVIPNYFISVASYVPIPVVSAVLSADGYITITSKVPVAFGSVVISKDITIAVTGISPVAEAAYNNIVIGSSSIVVTGTVPVVAIYKPTGEEDPGRITLSEQERFADVTLQYSRWPDAV